MKIYMPCIFPKPLTTGWGKDVILDINMSCHYPTRDEMKQHLQDADVAVINLDDVFDREMFEASPRLKVLCLFAGSTYNIDLDCARERNVWICTAQGEIFENTADLTFALLMAVARRIPEADRYIREGKYCSWGPDVLLGGDIYGKTIGILGMGTIGKKVAQRAAGFGMKILYCAKHGRKTAEEERFGAIYADRDTLLAESDFVCLHCKLTPDTEHIIGARELAMMKNTAYLINTGRGKLLDEKALADALENGSIAGAALDVFEDEPAVTEKLLKLSNCVLTPHLGASTKENRYAMAKQCADQIREFIK